MAKKIELEQAQEVRDAYVSVLNDNIWALKQLDKELTEFRQFLLETVNSDLGFDYESQYEEICSLEEDFETFKLATQEIIYAIDDMDSEFNDALSGCVERLSLIDINRYEVDNTAGIEYIEER